jgi:autoinducer 2 (AI-2) kinase
MNNSFLIVDIGTGNVRVAITHINGEVMVVERDDVHYTTDERYPNALRFDPEMLWEQILALTDKALQQVPGVSISAITASSQREGIVLLAADGTSLVGFPNHDHRGREWEHLIANADKSHVYRLTGRYPGSLFSAFKLLGLRQKYPELYAKVKTVMSISDWAQYKLSGITGYEHAQASETLLYDVAAKSWSPELCSLFDISAHILPELRNAGTILGNLLPVYASRWNMAGQTPVVVGGADTQLAIKSTLPSVDDVVIVSGTTTPIVKIMKEYAVDQQQRTWTNRHTDKDLFILEANAGVTGLNYQRLKEIFYPNEGYDIIEKELAALTGAQCMASLGSLVADEKHPLTKGGFIFDTPVSHLLNRACFVWAALWDIACCIKENYDCLCRVASFRQDYVWACSGGMQSDILKQFVSGLIDKKIQLRKGYRQASVRGGAIICSEAMGEKEAGGQDLEIVYPKDQDYYAGLYNEWKELRSGFKKIF